jgi:hypothetical protein
MTADRAWYAYGVVPAGTPPPPGVDGVVAGTLQALASPVDPAEFTDSAERDAAWLEAAVRAHEEVLLAALVAGPVLPLRFATVYSSRQRLRDQLDAHSKALAAELRRLSGRAEWGVRLVADEGAAEAAAMAADPRIAQLDAQLGDATSGTAYLLTRRRAALLRDALGTARQALGDELHAALSPGARDAVLVAGDGDTLLRAAYLVDDERVDAFQDAARAFGAGLAARGIDLQLTGPWPAHHFVRLDDELAT